MKIKINKKWSITDLPLNRLLTNGFEVIKRGVIKLNNIIGDDDVEIPFTPKYAYWDKDIYRFAYRVLEEPVLYKSILSKMPKELRKSLVCWLSPNLQGLTNAELFNSNNEYVGGLRDLSGNGHDMTLHGFLGVEGDGHVDEEGNLCFDGLNDYAINALVEVDATDICVIAKIKAINQSGAHYYYSYRSGNDINAELALGSTSGIVRYRGTSGSYTRADIYGESLVVQNGSEFSLNEKTKEISPTKSLMPTSLRVGCAYNNGSFTTFTLYSYIIFDRTLTDTELDWVKTNMLVSQEVAKRNVTLWLVDEESGSFDKFKTLKVQNGNMVGKYDEDDNLVLPIYDVDATHQTSITWYTDVECTEEYIGEYITEDTFLYAKKVKTSDNMLAQLDNVVLEDGTTAREHLVCWYSPKWQGATKESILAEPTLIDLSGNGYDLVLSGFTEDEEIIGEDGSLMFDGVDDYANKSPFGFAFTDFTLLFDIQATPNNTYSFAKYSSFTNTTITFAMGRINSGRVRSFGQSNDTITIQQVGYMTPTNYCGDNIVKGEYIDTDKTSLYLFFSNRAYKQGVLNYFISFDITLTTEERSKVKQILKLN